MNKNFSARTLEQNADDWMLNPESLFIGLEQELLVFQDGHPPALEVVKSVFEQLSRKGYRVARTDTDGRPLQVNRELRTGYVAVKNDFCTNLFEFALPPVRTPEELIADYNLVYSDLHAAFSFHGLAPMREAFIRIPSASIIPVPGTRLEWLMTRPLPAGGKYSDRLFAATIAATQMHFNILAEPFFTALPALYAFEYLVPLCFSNSADSSTNARCVRPLIYRDNYLKSYRALGFPDPVPTSRSEYQQLLDSTEDFRRDYTFIAPRSFGTVEFRSACAQPSIERILELTAFRLMTIITAHHKTSSVRLRNADSFMGACADTLPDPDVIVEDLELLQSGEQLLPPVWIGPWRNAVNRMRESLALLLGEKIA